MKLVKKINVFKINKWKKFGIGTLMVGVLLTSTLTRVGAFSMTRGSFLYERSARAYTTSSSNVSCCVYSTISGKANTGGEIKKEIAQTRYGSAEINYSNSGARLFKIASTHVGRYKSEIHRYNSAAFLPQ